MHGSVCLPGALAMPKPRPSGGHAPGALPPGQVTITYLPARKKRRPHLTLRLFALLVLLWLATTWVRWAQAAARTSSPAQTDHTSRASKPNPRAPEWPTRPFTQPRSHRPAHAKHWRPQPPRTCRSVITLAGRAHTATAPARPHPAPSQAGLNYASAKASGAGHRHIKLRSP